MLLVPLSMSFTICFESETIITFWMIMSSARVKDSPHAIVLSVATSIIPRTIREELPKYHPASSRHTGDVDSDCGIIILTELGQWYILFWEKIANFSFSFLHLNTLLYYLGMFIGIQFKTEGFNSHEWRLKSRPKVCLARLCASWLLLRPSKMKVHCWNCAAVVVISFTILAYIPPIPDFFLK